MAKFVSFPGTAGSYASTDDVNLLDADTAHLQQSIGYWAMNSATAVLSQSQDVTPVFGGFTLKMADTDTGTNFFKTAVNFSQGVVPVVAGTQYSYALQVQAAQTDAGVTVEIRNQYFDGAGGNLNNGATSTLVTPVLGSWLPLVITENAITNAAWVAQQVIFRNCGAGQDFYVDAALFAEGSDATFVPSLRIVGTLFEAFNSTPDDPPIAFAADGTPLTVGVSWAGDLFTYSRHDGADATAPIVAEFNAEDIFIP